MKQAEISLNAIVLVALLAATVPPSLLAHEGEAESGNESGAESSEPQSKMLLAGDPAPLFILEDQDGKKFALSDFNGQPRFITFIHTHCKDACPLILRNWQQIEMQLEPKIGKGIVFIAVTMDPQNDTPEVLKTFLVNLGLDADGLHLLSGDVKTVKQVLNDYNIRVARDPTTGFVGPHSTVGYAIDKKGIIEEIDSFGT
jgi:protein SCO1